MLQLATAAPGPHPGFFNQLAPRLKGWRPPGPPLSLVPVQVVCAHSGLSRAGPAVCVSTAGWEATWEAQVCLSLGCLLGTACSANSCRTREGGLGGREGWWSLGWAWRTPAHPLPSLITPKAPCLKEAKCGECWPQEAVIAKLPSGKMGSCGAGSRTCLPLLPQPAAGPSGCEPSSDAQTVSGVHECLACQGPGQPAEWGPGPGVSGIPVFLTPSEGPCQGPQGS